MKLKINGEEVTIEKAVSIKELLIVQKVNMPDYVTVQVNDNFIAAADFESTIVQDGDVIEFLYYMGGGQ